MPIQIKPKAKRKDYSVPVSLGLLGTGYGLSRLGKTMFSPEGEADALQGASYLNTLKSLPDEQKLPEYVNRMTKAVNTKLWDRYGVIDLMKGIRTYLPEMIIGKGHKWDATKNEQGFDRSSMHYQSFMNGPLDALREMTEWGEGKGKDNYTDKDNYINKDTFGTPSTGDLFDKRVKQIAEANKYEPLPSSRPKHEGVLYNKKDQEVIAKTLVNSPKEIDPAFHNRITSDWKAMAKTVEDGYAGYGGTVNSLLGVKDKLLIAGTAATVGGLGVLGLWAVKKYREREREKDKTKYKKPVSIDLPVAGANLSFH